MDRIQYNEFSLFAENISEYSLTVSPMPSVTRIDTVLSDGRVLSALKWGTEEPRLVLVHGSGQNAHTWDTVALALNIPLIAVDLPGHGHSSWRDDATYSPQGMAQDIAQVMNAHAKHAVAIVGMSLGGLTCLALAHANPELVPHLVLVDITPGVTSKKAKAVLDFINGPQSFASFDELFARTKEHNPTRSEASLRRGILHNAKQIEDGSWQWRYDRRGQTETAGSAPGHEAPRSPMWDMISSWSKPLLMVRGGVSPVVDDEDIAELSGGLGALHGLLARVPGGVGVGNVVTCSHQRRLAGGQPRHPNIEQTHDSDLINSWKRQPQRSSGNSSSAWLSAKSCLRSSDRLRNRPSATRVQTVLGYRPTSRHLDSDCCFAAKSRGHGNCPCKSRRNGTRPSP